MNAVMETTSAPTTVQQMWVEYLVMLRARLSLLLSCPSDSLLVALIVFIRGRRKDV